MLLVIDNYDSFVHNLARYLRRLGQSTLVMRNDVVDVEGVERLAPKAIVLSPGPGAPEDAGRCLEIVRHFADRCPILGVCLGHQAIAAALGGQIRRSAEPMHGRVSHIEHTGTSIFQGLPSPLSVGRYHSLVVEPSTLPNCLRPLAFTQDGVLMAMEHVQHPVIGVQFHPESILTESGYDMLANFLRLAGIDAHVPNRLDERADGLSNDAHAWPTVPITF